jgi:glycosyltransferase involved in cell wall biosynthesis
VNEPPAHVVLLRASDVTQDARAKKMAVTLSRLGLRVTVVCRAPEGTEVGEPAESALGQVRILRVPAPPYYSDALGVQRRRHRTAIGRWVPPTSAVRLRRLQGELLDAERAAARGRLKDADAGIPDRLAAASAEARWLLNRIGRRTQRARRDLAETLDRQVQDALARQDARRADRRRGTSWRRELVNVREFELRVAGLVDDLVPDVLHAHDVSVLALAVDAADRARAAGRTVPVVYDAIENWAGMPREDWGTVRRHEAVLRLEQGYARRAAAVLTVSEPIADLLQERLRLRDRPSVVLNAPPYEVHPRVPAQRVREAAGVGPGTPLVVYSGTVSAARRLDTLVQAVALLDEVHLAVVAVPYPHPSWPALADLAEQLGVADRVHQVAPVDPTELVAFLQDADAGLNPLLPGAVNHELALPNKLFEYLHAGLPLVVSEARETAAFVREHDLGAVYTSGDPQSLASAVRRVLETGRPDSTRAWELAQRFSWQSQESRVAAAYSLALGRRVAPPPADLPFVLPSEEAR